MNSYLNNSVAIVTGAGKGIGRAIATWLAAEGAAVTIMSRTQTDIDAVVRAIGKDGGKALGVRGDVSSEGDVREMVDQTIKKFGRIDVLVNNAGIGTFAPVSRLAVDDFDSMWRTNVRGVFLCTRAVLPHMQKQKSGDIVNISSLAGRNAFVGGAGYCATKWGLIGFARSLMLEVREDNIRVITLCPGSVDTAFGGEGGRARRSSGAIPGAEDIARTVIDALAMPRHVMVSEIDIRPTNPKG